MTGLKIQTCKISNTQNVFRIFLFITLLISYHATVYGNFESELSSSKSVLSRNIKLNKMSNKVLNDDDASNKRFTKAKTKNLVNFP